MLDGSQQTNIRKIRANLFSKVKFDRAIEFFTEFLNENNPFSRIYSSYGNLMEENNFSIKISEKTVGHQYRVPTEAEVAIVVPGLILLNVDADGIGPVNRVISVRKSDNSLFRISEFNGAFDPLHFPLLFPYGDYGFFYELTMTNGKNLSVCDFYRYSLMDRGRTNLILMGGPLLHEFLVHQGIKMETARLNYLRSHQSALRTDLYKGYTDAMFAGNSLNDIGSRVILPSSFMGSPRNMNERYHDSMALVRSFGKPSFFLTITANPKWEEITRELLPNQKPNDRPDLISRVFKLKLNSFVEELKGGTLGRFVAYVWVVKFQKRELSHAHLCLILDNSDVSDTSAKSISWCRPELLEIIKNCIFHGQCSAK